jgi:hypothetical protein
MNDSALIPVARIKRATFSGVETKHATSSGVEAVTHSISQTSLAVTHLIPINFPPCSLPHHTSILTNTNITNTFSQTQLL